MAGCRTWSSARNTFSAGNGHAWSPATPATALQARLSTNRYSTRKRMASSLAGSLGVNTRGARLVTPSDLRRGRGGRLRRLRRAPCHELTVFGDRGVNQLIEHVVGGVTDEPGVEHEGVTIRLLEPADVTHGLDPIGARLDERHTILLLSGARHGRDRDASTDGSRAVPSRDPVLRHG